LALTLQATLSDGSTKDATSTAQWFTSNGAVVTVSPAGLATAMGFGRATVNGLGDRKRVSQFYRDRSS
jgi:phage-related minor tail protein